MVHLRTATSHQFANLNLTGFANIDELPQLSVRSTRRAKRAVDGSWPDRLRADVRADDLEKKTPILFGGETRCYDPSRGASPGEEGREGFSG